MPPLAQLALVILATYSLFLYDMSRSRTRPAGRSETIATPFGVEEYAEFGQGEPVLVIHGAAGGFDQALEVTLPFAGYVYRLIAPSRFGYLASVARVLCRSSCGQMPTYRCSITSASVRRSLSAFRRACGRRSNSQPVIVNAAELSFWSCRLIPCPKGHRSMVDRRRKRSSAPTLSLGRSRD